jgi:hypothetical protein
MKTFELKFIQVANISVFLCKQDLYKWDTNSYIFSLENNLIQKSLTETQTYKKCLQNFFDSVRAKSQRNILNFYYLKQFKDYYNLCLWKMCFLTNFKQKIMQNLFTHKRVET